MPRQDRTIPLKKMLVDHDVIDTAILTGREEVLGEFLCIAQHDFQIFLLLDRLEDFKKIAYEGFVKGFDLLIEKHHIITKDKLSWLVDEDHLSDFHAIMSHNKEIYDLAGEMADVAEIYPEGYDEFRRVYNIFLAFGGQDRLSDAHIEDMVEAEEAKLVAEVEKKVPNLRAAWAEAQKDRLVENISRRIDKDGVRAEFLACMELHFRYACAGGEINKENSRDLIYASLHMVEIDETDIEAAITAVEYHAANALRPD